jgi:hypothetical protein
MKRFYIIKYLRNLPTGRLGEALLVKLKGRLNYE